MPINSELLVLNSESSKIVPKQKLCLIVKAARNFNEVIVNYQLKKTAGLRQTVFSYIITSFVGETFCRKNLFEVLFRV